MEDTFFPDKPSTFGKWLTNFEIVYGNRWSDMNYPKPKAEQLDISSSEGQKFLYTRFLEALGQRGRDFLDAQVTRNMSDSDKQNYKKIKEYLLEKCEPKINYIKVYGEFISCKQAENESLVEFINRVRHQAQYIGTQDMKFLEKMILTVIVYGLRNKEMVDKVLMLEKEPELEQTIQMLKSYESIRESSRNKNDSGYNVDKVSHRYKKKPSNRDYGNKDKPKGGFNNPRCRNCGSSHAHGNCPARNKQCHNCKKIGHYSVGCHSRNSNGKYRNRRNVNPVDEEEEQYEYADDDENWDQSAGKVFMGEVTTVDSIGTMSPSWTLRAHLGNKGKSSEGTTPVDFKIDTGAGVNCIPFSMYDRKRWGPLEPPGIRLLGAAETKLVTKGVVTLRLFYKNRVVTDRFYVIDKLKTPLLGLTGINKLEVVQRIGALTTDKGGDKAKWTQKFPELFNGLGTMKGTYKIELSENSEPLSVSSARRVPLPLLDAVKSELNYNQDQCI